MPSANQTRAEQFGPPNKKAPSTSVSRVPQILGFLHRPASMLFGKQPSAKSSHHRTSAPGQQDKQRSQPGSKTAGKKVSFPEPNQLLPTGNATKEATRVDSRSLRIPRKYCNKGLFKYNLSPFFKNFDDGLLLSLCRYSILLLVFL